MAVRKQRATTSMTNVMDENYDKAITQAKKIHRYDGLFYIGKVKTYYCSYDQRELDCNNRLITIISEKWMFENGRWYKESLE